MAPHCFQRFGFLLHSLSSRPLNIDGFGCFVSIQLVNDSMRNMENVMTNDKLEKDLRSLMVLTEIDILEKILRNVQRCDNATDECRKLVVELLMWRHCQSLSQGKCYESSISRNDPSNISSRSSFDHKNFKSFRNFIVKLHDKFGFDIISLVLHRTVPSVYIPVLVNMLVTRHNHDYSMLNRYQSVVMRHFEEFVDGILSVDNAHGECVRYFGKMTHVEESWLLAVMFVLEAMIVTDDTVWITCFKYMMEELGDVMGKLVRLDGNGEKNEFYIEDEKVRQNLEKMLSEMWIRIKGTKYLKDGYSLQKLNLIICHPKGWREGIELLV